MHTCCERRTWLDPKAGPGRKGAKNIRLPRLNVVLPSDGPTTPPLPKKREDLAEFANIGSGSDSKDLIDFPKTSYF